MSVSARGWPSSTASSSPAREGRRLQLVFAGAALAVLGVASLSAPELWVRPWVPAAVGLIALATLIALGSGRRGSRLAPASLPLVPVLDLLAVVVLHADAEIPRNVGLLACFPAFWLGFSQRRRGLVITAIAGLVLGAGMALRIPSTEGVVLTANSVGAVLIPVSLIGAAWLAQRYTEHLERQQAALLQREQERGALLQQHAADGILLDAIFETVRIGLVLIDASGQVERINPTLRDHPAMQGSGARAAMLDATFLELESRRPIRRPETPFVRAARGESFDNDVVWAQRPGQDLIAITVSSRPLMVDGDFRGSIVAVDDVTSYMRMLEDRDEFVALVSHELRTPLTSIGGYLELVLDEELPEHVVGWLHTMRRNTARLRALVEDLLIVGEMARGELRLEVERIDLRELAQDAVALLAHRARRRGVRLELVDGPSAWADGDPRRIAQVIENLISNGIKYTRDDGSVQVVVTDDGDGPTIAVSDDGIGMEPEEAARVFERFFRSAEARASGVQGAGLGLWICSMISQAHGGSLRFTSRRGVGSTATFSLPAAAQR